MSLWWSYHTTTVTTHHGGTTIYLTLSLIVEFEDSWILEIIQPGVQENLRQIIFMSPMVNPLAPVHEVIPQKYNNFQSSFLTKTIKAKNYFFK